MSGPRACAVCRVDLEPRPVITEVRMPNLGRTIRKHVRRCPAHARVRVWFEGDHRDCRTGIELSICSKCIENGGGVGTSLAVLADHVIERAGEW